MDINYYEQQPNADGPEAIAREREATILSSYDQLVTVTGYNPEKTASHATPMLNPNINPTVSSGSIDRPSTTIAGGDDVERLRRELTAVYEENQQEGNSLNAA